MPTKEIVPAGTIEILEIFTKHEIMKKGTRTICKRCSKTPSH